MEHSINWVVIRSQKFKIELLYLSMKSYFNLLIYRQIFISLYSRLLSLPVQIGKFIQALQSNDMKFHMIY